MFSRESFHTLVWSYPLVELAERLDIPAYRIGNLCRWHVVPNRVIRKSIKTRGWFPTDEAATKLIYLAIRGFEKRGEMYANGLQPETGSP